MLCHSEQGQMVVTTLLVPSIAGTTKVITTLMLCHSEQGSLGCHLTVDVNSQLRAQFIEFLGPLDQSLDADPGSQTAQPIRNVKVDDRISAPASRQPE